MKMGYFDLGCVKSDLTPQGSSTESVKIWTQIHQIRTQIRMKYDIPLMCHFGFIQYDTVHMYSTCT